MSIEDVVLLPTPGEVGALHQGFCLSKGVGHPLPHRYNHRQSSNIVGKAKEMFQEQKTELQEKRKSE
jgi:hypothetical protein